MPAPTSGRLPPSRCRCHTSSPVSALSANTHPVFDVRYTHPSATMGVLLKPPPSAAASDALKTHAGESERMLSGPIVVSSGWLRVFERSCPYCRHSPPGQGAPCGVVLGAQVTAALPPFGTAARDATRA